MVKYITRHGPVPGPCSPGPKDLHGSTLPNGIVLGSERRREAEEGTAASSSSSSRCCWRPVGASAPGSGRPAGLDFGLPRRVWTEPGRGREFQFLFNRIFNLLSLVSLCKFQQGGINTEGLGRGESGRKKRKKECIALGPSAHLARGPLQGAARGDRRQRRGRRVKELLQKGEKGNI